jgi:hypothetical protein
MPIGEPTGGRPDPPTDLCQLDGPRWQFVRGFAALAAEIQEPQHLSRFRYWNDSWAYWRSIAKLECVWQQYEDAANRTRGMSSALSRQQDARRTLLPLRISLVGAAQATMTHMLELLSDPGDLGVLTNIV